MNDAWKIVAVVAGGILIGVILFVACQQHKDWVARCEARGGHVAAHTNWYGKQSNTTYFCLSDDGRILDIQ